MIDLDKLYAREELEEFDLPNEGLTLVEYTPSPPPYKGLVPYTPSPPVSPFSLFIEGLDWDNLPNSLAVKEREEPEEWETKPMKFGKYKGITLAQVSQDTGYLSWMIKNGFHQDMGKDRHLRDMLVGFLDWKYEMELDCLPVINNSKADSPEVNPLSIDEFPWLVVAKQEFAPVAYKDVGKWLLFFDLHDLSERWRQVKHFYTNSFLEGVFQIKCSTRFDSPRSTASGKSSGVIALYCCLSHDQDQIMAIGRDILNLFEIKGKTIYYKTDEQSHEGTRVNKDVNHIYKLRL